MRRELATAGQKLDPRLRMVALMLVPAFVGHTLQLTAEDTPLAAVARDRFDWTPGWHLFLPAWVPGIVAVGLGLAVIGLGAAALLEGREVPRRWLSARVCFAFVAGLYAAHYLTYPFRIRNHMSHMFASLVGVLLVWAVLWLRGEREGRWLDREALRMLAMVSCVTYFFAGLHKLNWAFVDLRVDAEGGSVSGSSAVDGLRMFALYGDLSDRPPEWARALAAWGTIAIEMGVPVLAWRVPAMRVPAVILLMLFHVPHVAVMDVADYPMIASCGYPAFFSPGHARALASSFAPNRWNCLGAALGVATQLWFMPFWGRLTVFGIFVLGLWGYAAGAMLRGEFRRRRFRAFDSAPGERGSPP